MNQLRTTIEVTDGTCTEYQKAVDRIRKELGGSLCEKELPILPDETISIVTFPESVAEAFLAEDTN